MRLFVARTLAVLFSISILGALVIHASCTHAQDSISAEPQQQAYGNPPAPLLTSSAGANPPPVIYDDHDRFLPATKAAPVFVPQKSKTTKPVPQGQAAKP
jgi:hypothetical protein